MISTPVENRLAAGSGLFQLNRRDITQLQPVKKLDFARPIPVFLHGTVSITEGNFGDLWRSSGDTVNKLFDRYEDQVLSLRHRTLSLSSIENTLELLEKLV